MNKHPLAGLAVAAILACTCAGQSAGQSRTTAPSDGLALLKRVAQHYADAKSYRIELVEERATTGDLYRNWQKTIMDAAEAPGNRYRYQGESNFGRALLIADGTNVWSYRESVHLYTKQPIALGESGKAGTFNMDQNALMNSQQLRKRLAALAQHYNSATRLADQTVVVNGAKGRCYVVRVRAADMKRTSDDTAEETFWIDKKSETVVKSLQHGRIHMMNGSASVAEDEETSATYTRIELDAQIPDQFFAFTPPQDAALVDQFPNLMKPGGGPLFGRPAPILKLKSGSGELVSLDSFRGKPVILDVWATWCQPCIKALPQLASLYADAKDKGLVLLSVDQDEEASSASAFLAKNGYTWANFHDDGEIAKTLGSLGIPRTILINPQGTVVYDSGNLVGAGENQLRSEVAKLGPDYASLAPKPARTECGASQ